MLTQQKRVVGIVVAIVLILMIPFVAMQFTTEVDWSPMDFVIMGALLLGTGLICEMVLRSVKTVQKRVIYIGAVLFAFFLIWVERAVGLFLTVSWCCKPGASYPVSQQMIWSTSALVRPFFSALRI
jgi:hypothetical protein